MNDMSWNIDQRQPSPYLVTPLARIRWAEHRFRVEDADDGCFKLLCTDGTGTRRILPKDEIERLVDTGAIVIEHGHFNLDGSIADTGFFNRVLAAYPIEKQIRALTDLEWVKALDEDHRAGKVKLYADKNELVLPNGALPLNVWIAANLATIHKRSRLALRIVDPTMPKKPRKGGKTNEVHPPGVTQLKANLRKFRGPAFNVTHLVDRWDNCNQGGKRLAFDVQEAMLEVVNELFARNSRFTPAQVRKHIAAKLTASAGKTVKGPCHEAVARYISTLDNGRLMLGRFGFKRAREMRGSNAPGPVYTRVGEMILMDCWKVDMITLLKRAGAWMHMSRAQKRAWGLRRRVCLCVAIDAATRVVLGLAFGLSETPELSRRVLRMIVSDKTDEAEVAGCLAPPTRPIGMEGLRTDSGIAFRHGFFVSAALSLVDHLKVGIVGKPWRQGIMERFHRTPKDQLLAYFDALTHGNPVARGDYDAMSDAHTTLEVLGTAMFRWANDVHKMQEHRGLANQPPSNRLEETIAATGMKAAPSDDHKRFAFGLEVERQLTSQGFTYLGIEYKAAWLAKLFSRQGQRKLKMRLKVDPCDLGRISVFWEGGWHTVDGPADFRRVGVTAWKRTRKALAMRHGAQAAINFPIVARALLDIHAWGARERLEAGMIDMTYDNKKLADEADSIQLRVIYSPTAEQHGKPDKISRGAFGKGFATSDTGIAEIGDDTGRLLVLDTDFSEETVSNPLDDANPHEAAAPSAPDENKVIEDTGDDVDDPIEQQAETFTKEVVAPIMTSLADLIKSMEGDIE